MKRVVTNQQQAVAGSSDQKENAKKVAAKDALAANLADPSFSKEVIDWQKQHGRHALPWQNTRDAYRVWLSEIMLQQTQVAAVIPYYQRFLQTFPTVESLAAAPSEEVMAHWSGLGYYSRARNLHKCAQAVVARHGGVFPSDPVVLEELAGIGRSTAAAIAAFSYGTRAAILDGNVKRVFARVFGVERYPGEKAIENEMWLRAVALLPASGVETYTQGLMDLGATLCTRNRPSCQRCPLAIRCIAYATGRTSELPIRKPKKAVPEKSTTMLLIVDDDQIVLEQRPDKGIWGGLLSLPEMDAALQPGNADFDVAVARATAAFGVPGSVEKLMAFSHTFTHFKLHVTPYRINLENRLQIAGQGTHSWYPLHRMAVAPLPAPVKKLLLALTSEPDLLSAI